MTAKMWESTFWQEDYARPDKLTKFFNKVMTKDKGEQHTVHVNEGELKAAGATSGKFNVLKLFGGDASVSGDYMKKGHVTEDVLRSWLKEHLYEVEWTGEVFKVKPVDLYRLNTQQLAQKQNLATTHVQVHQVQFTYNVRVSFPGENNDIDAVATQALNNRLDKVEGAIHTQGT